MPVIRAKAEIAAAQTRNPFRFDGSGIASAPYRSFLARRPVLAQSAQTAASRRIRGATNARFRETF
jgi:hypothetical protein